MANLIVLGLVLCVASYVAWSMSRGENDFEKQIPCVGVQDDEWFAWTRAQLRSFSMTEKWMMEGYEKYSRHNLPFIIPSLRKGKALILPPSQLKFIYSKRENELHAHGPTAEALSFDYTIRDPAVYPNNYTVDVIRKWITKRFDEFTPELKEELCLAVDEQFGLRGEWRDARLWPAVQRVFTRGLNRVLVGFPLCRDPVYLETVRRFAIDMPLQGLSITLIPEMLKPIFGPLISWQARSDTKRGITACTPLIKARLNAFHKGGDDVPSKDKPPVDILQWILEASAATNDPTQLEPYRIGHRIMLLNFNLVQGGSIPFSTVLSDICNGPHASSTLSRLRDEAASVLGASSSSTTQPWDRATISKLVLADSAIRESMRWSDFGLFALPRRVSSAQGITLDDGVKIPRGVHVEIPMHGIHMDETFHKDAASFQPFRFADGTLTAARSAVTLDESFLGFGYGRNACPGRFFGMHVLKVVLAYFVLNYDVEFGDEMPPMKNIWEYRIPREDTALRIRRRESLSSLNISNHATE